MVTKIVFSNKQRLLFALLVRRVTMFTRVSGASRFTSTSSQVNRITVLRLLIGVDASVNIFTSPSRMFFRQSLVVYI